MVLRECKKTLLFGVWEYFNTMFGFSKMFCGGREDLLVNLFGKCMR